MSNDSAIMFVEMKIGAANSEGGLLSGKDGCVVGHSPEDSGLARWFKREGTGVTSQLLADDTGVLSPNQTYVV
jgi:hypothetical protein